MKLKTFETCDLGIVDHQLGKINQNKIFLEFRYEAGVPLNSFAILINLDKSDFHLMIS